MNDLRLVQEDPTLRQRSARFTACHILPHCQGMSLHSTRMEQASARLCRDGRPGRPAEMTATLRERLETSAGSTSIVASPTWPPPNAEHILYRLRRQRGFFSDIRCGSDGGRCEEGHQD